MEKCDLDNLMRQYKVQPVGQGYIDCIVSMENVLGFIRALSSVDIKVSALTWWCHCRGQNSSCPHGMGGPPSIYYDGWFSEMCHVSMVEFEHNEQLITYLKEHSDERIQECFVPALWLDIPALF